MDEYHLGLIIGFGFGVLFSTILSKVLCDIFTHSLFVRGTLVCEVCYNEKMNKKWWQFWKP